jgi:hypothetical protein
LTELEARTALLHRLEKVARKLPNGLLQRLVADAEFFGDWNLRKKRARASARMAQHRAWEAKAEDRYWKTVRR